jgi:hypothetical protein
MGSRRERHMRRRRHPSLIIAVASVAVLAACHAKPNTGNPSAAPLAMRSFGDTAAYGVQVLSLDREKEVAKVALRTPAQLIVLAVIPGREIELIVPSDLAKSSRGSFSKGVSSIDMGRWDVSQPADATSDARAAMEYNRCLQQAQAAARREAQARRPVRRDSTGKIIDDGRGSSTADEMEILARLERQCDRYDADQKRKSAAVPVRMPARAPADRYLVVLASSTPLTGAELGARLSTLTAVGSDVATTIEAIASGLYAGLPGTWSGGYVAW